MNLKSKGVKFFQIGSRLRPPTKTKKTNNKQLVVLEIYRGMRDGGERE